MAMMLCDQQFEGPLTFEAPGVRGDTPAVFVIVCVCKDGKKRMVDVGHSTTAHDDLTDPDNRKRWQESYEGQLCVYVWYPSESDDPEACQSLVGAIREHYCPICAR